MLRYVHISLGQGLGIFECVILYLEFSRGASGHKSET